MTKAEDDELKEVVKNATDKAEELFPRKMLSLKQRLALFAAGFLIVSNSVIGTIDTAFVAKQNACQQEQRTQQTAVRNADQAVTDKWVNAVSTITEKAQSENWTPAQLQNALEGARVQYNNDRKSNDAARAKILAQTCK